MLATKGITVQFVGGSHVGVFAVEKNSLDEINRLKNIH
jgi:hypothetical protein